MQFADDTVSALKQPAAILIGILALILQTPDSAAQFPPFRTGLSDLNLTVSSPFSGTNTLQSRIGYVSRRSTYNPAREVYRVIVPQNYTHARTWGLFIWIDMMDSPRFPRDWPSVLAQKGFVTVLLANAGNRRSSGDRIRMALDARHHMPRLFNIDHSRIIVSGWSGGARIASVLGVAYGDQFPNCVPMMGCVFYEQIPLGRNRFFPVAYTPNAAIVNRAKNNRFIIVTSQGDALGLECRLVYEHGFKANGFTDTRLVSVPTASSLPNGQWLGRILDNFLASGAR